MSHMMWGLSPASGWQVAILVGKEGFQFSFDQAHAIKIGLGWFKTGVKFRHDDAHQTPRTGKEGVMQLLTLHGWRAGQQPFCRQFAPAGFDRAYHGTNVAE